MATKLVKCPGCEKSVSLLAVSCSSCGYPIKAKRMGKLDETEKTYQSSEKKEMSAITILSLVILLSIVSTFLFPMPLMIVNIVLSVILLTRNNILAGIAGVFISSLLGFIGMVLGAIVWQNVIERLNL